METTPPTSIPICLNSLYWHTSDLEISWVFSMKHINSRPQRGIPNKHLNWHCFKNVSLCTKTKKVKLSFYSWGNEVQKWVKDDVKFYPAEIVNFKLLESKELALWQPREFCNLPSLSLHLKPSPNIGGRDGGERPGKWSNQEKQKRMTGDWPKLAYL